MKSLDYDQQSVPLDDEQVTDEQMKEYKERKRSFDAGETKTFTSEKEFLAWVYD